MTPPTRYEDEPDTTDIPIDEPGEEEEEEEEDRKRVFALMRVIEDNVADIYVKTTVLGVSGTYCLAVLPASMALHWAFKWIREQKRPQ